MNEQKKANKQASTNAAVAPKPQAIPPRTLPPWNVLLHNDDHNPFDYVILTLVSITPLDQPSAHTRALEAHKAGTALLLTTHRERAELYAEQLASKGLTVTIEAA